MSEYADLVEGFEGLTADEKSLLASQIQVNASRAAPEHNEIVSHGMTVNDQSTADAFDEILGASSSEGEHRPDVAEVAGSTPAGPIPSEIVTAPYSLPDDEPPTEEGDWPEPEPEIPVFPTSDDLRVLRSDHRPQPGSHYVIFGGKPIPVVRAFAQTEDEFVRSQMDPSDTLKDPDGQRRVRADRALRMRYRGYVSGEMSGL